MSSSRPRSTCRRTRGCTGAARRRGRTSCRTPCSPRPRWSGRRRGSLRPESARRRRRRRTVACGVSAQPRPEVRTKVGVDRRRERVRPLVRGTLAAEDEDRIGLRGVGRRGDADDEAAAVGRQLDVGAEPLVRRVEGEADGRVDDDGRGSRVHAVRQREHGHGRLGGVGRGDEARVGGEGGGVAEVVGAARGCSSGARVGQGGARGEQQQWWRKRGALTCAPVDDRRRLHAAGLALAALVQVDRGRALRARGEDVCGSGGREGEAVSHRGLAGQGKRRAAQARLRTAVR